MLPNILLVVMDTARVDAFEPWGASAGSTPVIGQLARQGRCLTDVRSTANWTVPGHASMFGGALPSAFGLGRVENVPSCCTPAITANEHRWLPHVLRAQGYKTAGISANLWISAHSGFDAGFDRFESVVTTRPFDIHEGGLPSRIGWALEGARARTDDGAAKAEQILARWMDAKGADPFFWFVNLTECHSPYLPQKPYNDLGPLGRLRAADESRRYLTLESIWKTSLGLQEVPTSALSRMRHLYDRSILAMDTWLGRVLERLDEHGLLETTLVVVASDHGENFGECGLIGHCLSLDDRLLRVPVVASQPTFAPDGMRSLSELPALLATAVGLPDHPWSPTPAGGVAVAERDVVFTHEEMESVSEAWHLDDTARQALVTSATCAVEGTTKLVREHGGREVLYDLADDLLETNPLTKFPDTDAVQRLRDALDQVESGATASFEPPPVTADDEESALIAKKMRELGYL